MRRTIITTLATVAFAVTTVAPVAAAPPDEPPAGCWGELSRGQAQAGEMGEHASSFAGQPRVGLANLVPGGMSGLCEFLGG